MPTSPHTITGFGQTGPYNDRSGYDYLVQAMGGQMELRNALGASAHGHDPAHHGGRSFPALHPPLGAEMAAEAGMFDFADVVEKISDKMIDRHRADPAADYAEHCASCHGEDRLGGAGRTRNRPMSTANGTMPPRIAAVRPGNPLAIAAALAVLEVIEDEDLCARAEEIGSAIRSRLQKLAERRHDEGGDPLLARRRIR
ncbi:aminotransferase class III-fold pyridoxal phosphate-dependent enzyme, partial [Paracoccus sp. APAP_BH8]|uniref:aminotransferase class III-fold pyridoxal phosphate-dependent enzyme n=1 Tax=Paracoccus sp. APAP_BH8 TaxID=3110237 RepID=UPI002FD7A426